MTPFKIVYANASCHPRWPTAAVVREDIL